MAGINNSLAAFRPPAQHQQDLATLARTHFENDLTREDRDVLRSVGETMRWSANLGSLVGIGVGCLLAYRVRRLALRRDWFYGIGGPGPARGLGPVNNGVDRPARVVYESGKSVDIPNDMTTNNSNVLASTTGDLAAYMLLGLGGLFLGGETGFLAGTVLASRKVAADEGRVKRVREAYRRFKVDALRKEAEELEKYGAGEEVVW